MLVVLVLCAAVVSPMIVKFVNNRQLPPTKERYPDTEAVSVVGMLNDSLVILTNDSLVPLLLSQYYGKKLRR